MTNKLLGATLLVAVGATMLFAQTGTKSGKHAAAEQNIQKSETSLWQAWKDHDSKPFEEHLTADSINVVGSVERGKANILKAISSPDCQVTGFSLSDFDYSWLDKKSVIVTYQAAQDASCNGKKIPAKVNASSVWVKRGGRWMTAFHQESPSM